MQVTIHGLRIYPQSVEVVRGQGANIFVHGTVSNECSDFYYVFRPLSETWRTHYFIRDFGLSYTEKGTLENPMPGLREQYGSSLVTADVESQTLILAGVNFPEWGRPAYFCEGAFIPIFRTMPDFVLLKELFWGHDFILGPQTWPTEMRALLHMWDDIYWELYTLDPADIGLLIRAHDGDPKLKMFHVDFDREYPNPSNQSLRPAVIDDDARRV